MARLDADSINQDIQENPFIGQDPAVLRQKLSQLKRQQFREKAQTGLEQVGDIFLQRGGIQPAREGGLNELIQLEKFRLTQDIEKEKAEERRIKTKKAQLELTKAERAETRQEELRKQAEGVLPTAAPPTVTPPPEAPPIVPTEIPTAPPTVAPTVTAPLPTPAEIIRPEAPPPEKITRIFQDEKGEYKIKEEKNPAYDIWATGRKKEVVTRAEFGAKVQMSKERAVHNLELISNSMFDLATLVTEGYETGGMGDRWRAAISGMALWWGGDISEQFAALGALGGKVTEIVGKMMPMMTQQIGKEGSIRLIRSIFERLAKTIPEKRHLAPATARRMMKESILSFYRINRAIQMMEIDGTRQEIQPGESATDYDKRVTNLISEINTVADRMEIVGDEKVAFDNLVSTSLRPLDEYIAGRDGKVQEAPISVGNIKSITEE